MTTVLKNSFRIGAAVGALILVGGMFLCVLPVITAVLLVQQVGNGLSRNTNRA